MTTWTTPDLLRRFRWRYRLYQLGWALVWAAVPAGIAVILLTGDPWLAGTISFMLLTGALLPMLPANTCLNCGAAMQDASISQRFRCRTCDAVHLDPDGRLSARSAGATRPLSLPEGADHLWLHPPMVARFARLARLSRVGVWLFALGLVSGGIWWHGSRTGEALWASAPHAPLAALILLTSIGLFLFFIDSRCPHCRAFWGRGYGQDNRMLRWCGGCNGVLMARTDVFRLFAERGQVVDEAPLPPDIPTVDETIIAADRLASMGDRDRAIKLVRRALLTHPNDERLGAWIVKDAEIRMGSLRRK